jgi:hypothetical protein
MFCGTGSPIVSGASTGAFARPKSFTFSLIIKRCSWVRLIVRGWGAIAGLSASAVKSLRYICKKCSFPGRVYIPRDQDVRGGVLVLHGSEGGGFGIHDRTAVLLACHGFTALAYDWCGSPERSVDGLPSKVVDIPIEGPVKALRWLQRHESVRNKPLAIHGLPWC